MLSGCFFHVTELNKFRSALAQPQISASRRESMPVPRRYHIKWYCSTIALVLQCIRLDTAVSSVWYCSGEKDNPERQRGAMRKSPHCIRSRTALSLPMHRIAFLTALYKEQTHSPIYYNLLLSGKTQNRIKSLSELLYNQGFGLFHDKSKPPLMKKHRLWGCFLNISCNNIIPCFVRILHKRDKVDVVHECEANHCYHL